MRIGVVAEGPSEALLMEALIDAYYPGSEVRRIQPDLTLASQRGSEWRGVRAWCQENGPVLDLVMRGIQGDELDLLVVHADCSMAHNVEAAFECPPPEDTADALRAAMVTDWLGLGALPNDVVLMTPSKTTDTWFLVGLGLVRDELEPIECSLEVEGELARLRIYRWKQGQVKKSGQVVARVVVDVVEKWDAVTTRCGEAARFWHEFRLAAA